VAWYGACFDVLRILLEQISENDKITIILLCTRLDFIYHTTKSGSDPYTRA
jgi:hypothetical protein